jgi:hypothetical protein
MPFNIYKFAGYFSGEILIENISHILCKIVLYFRQDNQYFQLEPHRLAQWDSDRVDCGGSQMNGYQSFGRACCLRQLV